MIKQAVCALIYNPDNHEEILFVSRKNNHSDIGLPGGKVDEGETLEKAIIREVFEETGYRVKVVGLIFTDKEGDYLTSTFLCSIVSGKLETSESGLVKFGVMDQMIQDCCTFRDYNMKLIDELIWNKEHEIDE